jgi:Reverse transcriptase (RNA-dependent DNA polymerase)
LKVSIKPVASIIAILVNHSFEHGYFPDALKIAKVCPIFKSGDKKQFSNYRPISILPSLSKIYEKAMHTRLVDYLNKNKLLVNNQYGFRANHSPYMAMLDMCDKITRGFDQGKITLAIFLDLQKAFDSLNHKILLQKMSYYGIRGNQLKWFTSYLTNRVQYTTYNNVLSARELITWGIPQGSILGPLLFIIFINDIVNCTSLLHYILFADDTNACCSGNSLEEVKTIANVELEKLSTWFCANNLSINVKKTNYILFRNKRRFALDNTFKIFLSGQELEMVQSTKFLGILIDEDLNWKTHTSYIASKVAKNVGIIYRNKNALDKRVMKLLYISLIQPYLNYCIIVWGSAYDNALKSVTLIQKRAIRTINNAAYLAHTPPLFLTSKVLTIQDLYHKELAVFAFRNITGSLPDVCAGLLVRNDVIKTHATRKVLPYFKTVVNNTILRDKFVSTTASKYWNVLPSSLQNAPNLMIFKKRFVEFIWSKSKP